MFDKWVAMEQFYYRDLWYVVVIMCFFAFIFFPALKYYKKIIGQIIIISTIIVMIIGGKFIFDGYQEHSDLITLTRFANPANRRIDKKTFSDFPYSHSEYSLYRSSYMAKYFEKIQLYDKVELRSPVEYLGHDDAYYYVSYGNEEYYYVGKRFIEFSDQADQAERWGVKFILKDPQFTEIGFIENSSKFFERYVVPSAYKDKKVADHIRKKAYYQASMQLKGWIVP